MLSPITERFVASIEDFVVRHGLDLVTFRKGERKDDITRRYLGRISHDCTIGEETLALPACDECCTRGVPKNVRAKHVWATAAIGALSVGRGALRRTAHGAQHRRSRPRPRA